MKPDARHWKKKELHCQRLLSIVKLNANNDEIFLKDILRLFIFEVKLINIYLPIFTKFFLFNMSVTQKYHCNAGLKECRYLNLFGLEREAESVRAQFKP